MLTWAALEEVCSEPRWVTLVAALAIRAGESGGAAMARRLALSGRPAAVVREARPKTEHVLAAVAAPAARPSQIVAALERAPRPLAIVAMAHAGNETRRLLRLALTTWLRSPLPITGARLLAAGAKPGPAVGDAVRRARAAVLDGEIDAQGALDFALALLTGQGRTG